MLLEVTIQPAHSGWWPLKILEHLGKMTYLINREPKCSLYWPSFWAIATTSKQPIRFAVANGNTNGFVSDNIFILSTILHQAGVSAPNTFVNHDGPRFGSRRNFPIVILARQRWACVSSRASASWLVWLWSWANACPDPNRVWPIRTNRVQAWTGVKENAPGCLQTARNKHLSKLRRRTRPHSWCLPRNFC